MLVVPRWTHRTCCSSGLGTYGRWDCPGNHFTQVLNSDFKRKTLKGDCSGWIQCNPRGPGTVAGRQGFEEHSKQSRASCEETDQRRFRTKGLCRWRVIAYQGIYEHAWCCEKRRPCDRGGCWKPGSEAKTVRFHRQSECCDFNDNQTDIPSHRSQGLRPSSQATHRRCRLRPLRGTLSVSTASVDSTSSIQCRSWSCWKSLERKRRVRRRMTLRWSSERKLARLALPAATLRGSSLTDCWARTSAKP